MTNCVRTFLTVSFLLQLWSLRD
ncbi:hypothetical protein LEMLEM_LOCUS9773 [Lemmus lemmus]